MDRKTQKEVFLKAFYGKPEDYFGNGGNFQVNPVPSASVSDEHRNRAETSIEELKNKYASEARAEYENSARKLREERDDALRENWILQQKALAALPEELAAAGINGGAAETTLANLNAEYQGSRNDLRRGYMDELGDLAAEQEKTKAENAQKTESLWLDYLISLAAAEQKQEYDLEKAKQQYRYSSLLG